MLYSYLLTQGEFKLQPVPENATRDKRFAYELYADLLLMIVRLSGMRVVPEARVISGVDDNRYLSANRIGKLLWTDRDLRMVAVKTGFSGRYSDALISDIYNQIVRSAAYRSFIRLKNHELADDVKFWTTIVNSIFAKSPELMALARNSELFSTKGFEDALMMTSSAVEEAGDFRGRYVSAINALKRSLDKAYELYHALLALPVELVRLEDQRLDAARHKFLATADDLNPNMRFVENGLVKLLSEDEDLKGFMTDHPFSWNDDPVLLRSFLSKILASDIYKEYMEADSTDLKSDCEFWRNIFRTVILPSDDLAEALENLSVYWNDDLDIVGTFVMKTIRRFADQSVAGKVLLPQFKDEEDAAFGNELFVDTVGHFEEYRSYIDRFIDRRQWDADRLAFMDVVIMTASISELLNYPAIPIAVTLNEYIEIANCYSTPKSGQFINGILFSVINYLKNEGKLNKN